MDFGLRDLLKNLKVIFLIVSIGASVSAIYFFGKKRVLFGGFIGGLIVGAIGAMIGGVVLELDISKRIIHFLTVDIGFNMIAGFIGSFIALFIMNKLNHDRERKKY